MHPFAPRTVRPGMEVVDVNGLPLGTVAEAGYGWFLLCTSRADVRVSMEAVFTVETQVTLLCNADSLGRYLAEEG